ncbi:hypothetical protein OXIME_001310 [Oxyplasma meridianum]|uniref:Uncharacterized protein n=1 Tax=Oxyplasma meridianum TaxID=3073602 RepID=A0AAX4NIU1_9ARCH
MGDARKHSFLDSSFDATLLLYLFYLIKDNRKVMLVAGRVTREMVMPIVKEH